MDAQLTGLGSKQVSIDSDDVADIEQFVQAVCLVGYCVLFDIDLQLLAVLDDVQEACFAHATDRKYSSSDTHGHVCAEFFSSFAVVFAMNLWNRVRLLESVPVRLKPKLLNLRDAMVALAEQFVF
jgi:hypothetical protein